MGAYGLERPVEPLSADSYKLLLLGVRAQAEIIAGDAAAATRALTARRDALAARYATTQLDEDLLELALCEAQLARLARQQAAPIARVIAHLTAARQHIVAWSASTNTPYDDTGLAVLAAFAEVHLFDRVPTAQLGFDLPAELSTAYTQLSALRNPAWEPIRARLAVYLTMLKLRSPG
jgi:hypothetical protein